MKAVAYRRCLPISDPEALRDVSLPDPVATGRDLLVRVHAVSVNPVDTKVRRLTAPPPDTDKVLGWDAVGIVEAVGPDVTSARPGDRVWYAGSIDRQGSNAELQLVDERIAGRMPSTLSFAEAAAMPLTSITAWELLFDRLGVTSDSEGALLIVGAGGGVGSVLTQIARQRTRLTVIGTASRAETSDWVRTLGAHHVADHAKPLAQELRRLGVPEVQYVASLTQTDRHYAQLVEALAPQGRLGLIDDPATPLDISAMKRKSLSLHWELMFTRALFKTPDMVRQHDILDAVAGMVESGELRTTLAAHYGQINAENLRRAHALLESGTARGKVVLEGFGS